MHICLNYFGQPRNIENTIIEFNQYIHSNDNNINYSILYTTWDTENVDEFKKHFKNSYINLIEKPDLSKYDYLINNYTLDYSNSYKNIEHYVLGLYIKKMSYTTIINFEKSQNINFDFIITLRTDTCLNNHLSNFYSDVIKNLNNTVYVANHPKFSIHNQPSLPNTFFIADKRTTKKILEELDISQYCNIKNTNFFHPESSFYNVMVYSNIDINELDLYAFTWKYGTFNYY